MSSDFRRALTTLVLVFAALGYMDYHLLSRERAAVLQVLPMAHAATPQPQAALRVCADPNNLPFSNRRGEGFENQLAVMLAAELHRSLEYTWWPQRRGFIKNTLNARRCDLLLGVPAGYEMVDTTRAYYTSSYVFVARRDRKLQLASFDDPRLRTLRIGVHAIGDDYNNVPPVESLALRGLVHNLRGYPIYGAYSQPDPPRNLLDALVRDEIDVGIAWGPLAGYFASREPVALCVQPILTEDPKIPLHFAIAMGVRHGDSQLRRAVDRVLVARAPAIESILRRYGVPLAKPAGAEARIPGATP